MHLRLIRCTMGTRESATAFRSVLFVFVWLVDVPSAQTDRHTRKPRNMRHYSNRPHVHAMDAMWSNNREWP